MSITSTDGVIALDGTVDGVDFAALRNKVVNHDHALAGNVDNVSESITIAVGDGNFEVSFTSTPTDDDISIEGANPTPNPRVHNHGLGTLAEDGTNTSTALSPSGTETTLTGTNGNVDCRTIDGYAPEVVYDLYEDHDHDMTGSTANTTPSAISLRGVSGASYQYFRVASDSSGTGAAWETVTTATAAHNHPVGTLKLNDLNAGAAPTASGSQVQWGPNNLATDGNVNGVDISAFKTEFDSAAAGNHRHQGTGSTAKSTGAATRSQMKGSSGKAYFSNGAGTWRLVYVDAYVGIVKGEDHLHGGTSIYNSNVT